MNASAASGSFPPVAPNGFDYPHAVRATGADLVGFVVLYGMGLVGGLALAAASMSRGVITIGPGLALSLTGVVIGLFCAWSLWRLRLPSAVFHDDRVEIRGLVGQRALYRRDLLGVGRDIRTRGGGYFLIYPQPGMGPPIQMNAKVRDDRVVAAWLAGAADPQAVAVAADRAAVLADPRYGATEADRAARLGLARKAMVVFNVACLVGAAALGFFGPLNPTSIVEAAGALGLGAVIASLSDGLIVWLPTWKARPAVVGAVAPLLALCLRATFVVHLVDPGWLIITAIAVAVAVCVVLIARPPMAFGTRGAAPGLGGLFGLCLLGAVTLIDVAFDTAPPRLFATTVQDKRVSHGRSTTYYLSLALSAGRTSEDVAVGRDRYDRTGLGDVVCVANHPGLARLAWYEIEDCPAGVQPSTTVAGPAQEYPPRARRLRVEGSALVNCVLSGDATATDCHVISETPAGYGFGAAAVGRVQGVKFPVDPLRLNADRRIRVPVVFRIPH